MLFSTPLFLFYFLPAFFALYAATGCARWVLLAGSLFFYAWGEPGFTFVVLASAVFDWLLARAIHGSGDDRRRHVFLILGLLQNLGILFYVKYAGFAVENVNAVAAHFGGTAWSVPKIILPLAVSFITFEKITYLVDIFRKVASPAASLVNYLNYVFLFPKLLAGPIVKYHDIAAQLERPVHDFENVREGVSRFVQGLAKKVLIADILASTADTAFGLLSAELTPQAAWVGLLCFTMQIYFDFSGYSDMALGLARILGFRLLENFRDPYTATSFTDFWRRWHISLSTWIREYLYIPLGGNRCSVPRSYANLCICFLASGLWHGAAWNFVLWGALHGLMLMFDRAFWLKRQACLGRIPNVALTFLLVSFSWVVFRCTSLTQTADYFAALFGRSGELGHGIILMPDAKFALLAACVVSFWRLIPMPKFEQIPAIEWRRAFALCACFCVLPLCFGRVALSNFHPFLYFRF